MYFLVDQKSNKIYVQRRPQWGPEFGEVSQYQQAVFEYVLKHNPLEEFPPQRTP